MGIISLGIGPPTPNITYFITSGLLIGEAVEVSTIAATVTGPGIAAAVIGPPSTGSLG